MNNFLLFIFYILYFSPSVKEKQIVIHFDHVIKNEKLERGKNYSNIASDTISISKLKYYISHLQLQNAKGNYIEYPGIFLIDAFKNDSIVATLPEGKYKGIKFMLGIDSALHAAGVQEGALDPLNDMYWAWNSGYVNFKLEGNSPQANTDLHRLQYHIGGFAGTQKTMQEITIYLSQEEAKADKKNQGISIIVNVEKLWNDDARFTPASIPMVIKAGDDAVKISKQFPLMFSVAEPVKIISGINKTVARKRK